MYVQSNQWITLVAGICYAAVFLRVLWLYVHHHDPVERDVGLVFLPPTIVFALEVGWTFFGLNTALAETAATAIALAQPYLTLRLARLVHHTPRWLPHTALVAYLVMAFAFIAAPDGLASLITPLYLGVYALTALAAAIQFGNGARIRRGPATARLWAAAGATVLLAAGTIGVGALEDIPSQVAAQTVGVVAGLGYLVAFLPPRLLRHAWLAGSWNSVGQHLLNTPADATASEIWHRYAEVIHMLAGATAVVVLIRTPGGGLRLATHQGLDDPTLPVDAASELDELLAVHPPVRLTAPRGPAPGLRAYYASRVDADFLTPLRFTVPPGRTGALLIFTRHRSLFAEDDLNLVATLGGQVGILADRGEVIENQRQMAGQLAATIGELRTASQAKSSFLASMSHELRTPLNAIIGFSDLMRAEPAVDGMRTVPADWPDHIHNSGRHLLGLINDVLDLAKVEAGRMDLQTAPLRLDTLAAEVLTSLRPLVDGKDLIAEIDMRPTVAAADPIRFRQMLENLLSNAIKFTPPNGRITITGGVEDGQAVVTVADTGVGIAPADQQRVFLEFQQVGDPNQRKSGTGLGLALTQRLAQAHGGDITLESSLGKGSRFSIRIPTGDVVQPTPQGPPPAAAPTPAAATGRVLLIEDDPQAAELVRKYLSGTGYQIEVAPTGESGVAAVRARPPDVVLLDIVLPGVQGWDVLRQLKSDPKLAHIPVLLITGVDDRGTGAALGAADYLIKPVGRTELLAGLARHALPPDGQGPPSVLVVGSDDENRCRVAEDLRAAGAAVVSCTSVEQCLEASRRQQFDLVVCDLATTWPERGESFMSRLRDEPATRNTAVLTLTEGRLAATDGSVLVGAVHGTATERSPAWQMLVCPASDGNALQGSR